MSSALAGSFFTTSVTWKALRKRVWFNIKCLLPTHASQFPPPDMNFLCIQRYAHRSYAHVSVYFFPRVQSVLYLVLFSFSHFVIHLGICSLSGQRELPYSLKWLRVTLDSTLIKVIHCLEEENFVLKVLSNWLGFYFRVNRFCLGVNRVFNWMYLASFFFFNRWFFSAVLGSQENWLVCCRKF